MTRFLTFLLFLSTTVTAVAQTYPYQDASLTPEERAQDLLGRLTVEQKVMLMDYDSPEIPEFGIRRYNWWNEALHGVARAGVATVFPQAIGLAATFDEDFLEEIADAICRMRDDRELYDSCKENLKKAKEDLCWEKEKSVLQAAYRKVLQ